ncbi:DNA mismatch repair protein MLH3-like isoform X2 [Solanum lycopersicum]|uniref:DNA mismatch repair protein MLH3-like isoform X2 n=1 Tax=Solanum lycopersicum TaxID=4081 RepID=UPI003747EAC1
MLRWMTMQHQNTAIQMLCMLSHVIINHAADERISLEELHEKIMPETGYQLLHNYTDQIQNWSLICKVHSQASISSTRLNVIWMICTRMEKSSAFSNIERKEQKPHWLMDQYC